MWLDSLIAVCGGALVSGALVWLARRWAPRLGLVAHPTSDRWHKTAVGKLGGVAMAAACVAVWPWTGLLGQYWSLAVGALLVASLGLLDDIRPIRPGSKLVGQIVVAAGLLFFLPPVSLTGHVVLDYTIGFVWIVGLTNAFNLLDNIDGLAAGIAAIAAVGLALSLLVAGDAALRPLALGVLAFAGVCVGFLAFNFQPASVFMGDSGSHLLGFFISAAALAAVPGMDQRAVWPAVVGPVVTLLIPIFDTTLVTITRGLTGRGIFQGGRDHASHRLVALGISERRAVVVLYALAAVGAAIGLSFHGDSARYAWGIAGLYVAVLTGLGLYLGHLDAHRPDEPPALSLPTELTTRYRGAEVALDAAIIVGAYYLAFGIRFGEPEFSHFLPYFAQSVPVVLVMQLGGLALTGKYRQIWHSFGVQEAASLLRGVALGVTGTVVAVLYLYRFEGFSRAVFAIDAALVTAFLLATRAGLGSLDDFVRRRRSRGRQALIIGAGRGGALAVRELLQNPDLGLTPCGFLDDDPAKQATRVDGYRVLGPIATLADVLDRAPDDISSVVIAIKHLPPEHLDAILQSCDTRRVPVRRMRFSLEDTDWRDRQAGVVRFPER